MSRALLSSLVLIMAFALVACSSAPKRSSEFLSQQATSAEAAANLPSTERQYLKNGDQKIQVKKIQESAEQISEITRTNGGFIERSSMTDERGTLNLRVPNANLEKVMKEIASVGKEEDRRIEVVDVTGEVIDLKARIENLVQLRESTRALTKRTNNISELLELEKQLSRLQTEIDQLQGRLQALQTNVALSQLTVQLNRERVLGPLGYLVYGLAWGAEKLFVIQ